MINRSTCNRCKTACVNSLLTLVVRNLSYSTVTRPEFCGSQFRNEVRTLMCTSTYENGIFNLIIPITCVWQTPIRDRHYLDHESLTRDSFNHSSKEEERRTQFDHQESQKSDMRSDVSKMRVVRQWTNEGEKQTSAGRLHAHRSFSGSRPATWFSLLYLATEL